MSARADGIEGVEDGGARATPFDGVSIWVAVLAGALVGGAVSMMPRDVAAAVVGMLFVAAAVIDVRTRRIPNALSAAALALGLVAAALAGQGMQGALGAAAALGAGLALHIGARGAFGLGDVKLMAGAGAAVGVAHVLDFLLAMALAGGAIAIVLLAMRRGRRATMPYGPAIAAGVLAVLLLTR